MRVAAIQLNSTADKAGNLEAAERLVRAAAAAGAELVALPEKWNVLATPRRCAPGAEPLDGPTLSAARGWARELGHRDLSPARSPSVPQAPTRLSNTSVLIDAGGEIAATYRKIHLFDVDVGGVVLSRVRHEAVAGRTCSSAPSCGGDRSSSG